MIVKSVQIDNTLHNAVNDAITSDKPVKVKTNAGNAVILSENTYNAIWKPFISHLIRLVFLKSKKAKKKRSLK